MLEAGCGADAGAGFGPAARVILASADGEGVRPMATAGSFGQHGGGLATALPERRTFRLADSCLSGCFSKPQAVV